MNQNILRTIPSVNELLESPEISKLTDLYPRQLIVEAIREVLEDIRQSLTNKTDLSPQKLFPLVQQVLQQKFCGIEHAINATGIVLHTGLGRAPPAEKGAKKKKKIF